MQATLEYNDCWTALNLPSLSYWRHRADIMVYNQTNSFGIVTASNLFLEIWTQINQPGPTIFLHVFLNFVLLRFSLYIKLLWYFLIRTIVIYNLVTGSRVMLLCPFTRRAILRCTSKLLIHFTYISVLQGHSYTTQLYFLCLKSWLRVWMIINKQMCYIF